MSSSANFEPIWPPASDKDFEAWPEVREARKLYEAQKAALGELAAQARDSNSGEQVHRLAQEIATLLHNISGTGAHFGDGPFGRRAGELEQPVRGAFTAEALLVFCAEILGALSPQRPT